MTNLNIHNAIIFATLKHQTQNRKGTSTPYIVHPMEVMQILTDMHCKESVIIAGILHDTLEDTETTPDEIALHFGKDVLAIVQTESEDKSIADETKCITLSDFSNEYSAEKAVEYYKEFVEIINKVFE